MISNKWNNKYESPVYGCRWWIQSTRKKCWQIGSIEVKTDRMRPMVVELQRTQNFWCSTWVPGRSRWANGIPPYVYGPRWLHIYGSWRFHELETERISDGRRDGRRQFYIPPFFSSERWWTMMLRIPLRLHQVSFRIHLIRHCTTLQLESAYCIYYMETRHERRHPDVKIQLQYKYTQVVKMPQSLCHISQGKVDQQMWLLRVW